MHGESAGDTDFLECLAQMWYIVINTEIQANVDSTGARVVAVFATFTGIFVASVLIGT